MFGLRKTNNPYAQPAKAVYAVCLEHVREPRFYTDFGVPDTFDGRFDLLLVHGFIVINAALKGAQTESEEFNQAFFDALFSDMDQTLRTMGVGDVGIPKHMRKMMLAFNGRMHAYDGALENGDWATPLTNNLYGTVEDVSAEHLKAAEGYIVNMVEHLAQDDNATKIVQGQISFKFDELDKE